MSLYKQDPNGPWWVSITHPGVPRIRRSTGTTDRQEAQDIHDEIKRDLRKNMPRVRGRTWGMAVEKWIDRAERSESELLSLTKFARYFPDRVLTDITREDVDKALRKFVKTPGTYTRYRTMIAAILNVVKDEGWLKEVPKLTSWTQKKKKPRTWITPEQWAKLRAELPAHLEVMARFALATGLRQANVFGLQWQRVDAERRLVWVEGEDTKAGEAIAVPLSDEALTVLDSVRGQDKAYCFVYRGKPIKDCKTAFIAACIRAGLGSYDGGRYEGFTWHGFRHTWATWHVQNGTPLEVLQKLGGWSDMRMVMNYAHHAPGFVAQFANNAASKMPKAL